MKYIIVLYLLCVPSFLVALDAKVFPKADYGDPEDLTDQQLVERVTTVANILENRVVLGDENARDLRDQNGQDGLPDCLKKLIVRDYLNGEAWYSAGVLEPRACVTSMAALFDNRLVCGLQNGAIEIWDVERRKCVEQWQAHFWGFPVAMLSVLADNCFASCRGCSSGKYGREEIKIWREGQCVQSFKADDHYINQMVVLPNNILVTIKYGVNTAITRYSLIDGSRRDSLIKYNSEITHCFAARSHLLAFGKYGAEQRIDIIDTNTDTIVYERVMDVSAAADGLQFVSDHCVAFSDKHGNTRQREINLWNFKTDTLTTVGLSNKYIDSLLVLPNNRLASIVRLSMNVWDLKRRESVQQNIALTDDKELKLHRSLVGMVLLANGKLVSAIEERPSLFVEPALKMHILGTSVLSTMLARDCVPYARNEAFIDDKKHKQRARRLQYIAAAVGVSAGALMLYNQYRKAKSTDISRS